MMSLEQIQNFFPANLRDNPAFRKYMLKEYIQLQILDFLSTTAYIRKVTFIGGTCLRLVKGIDRFSEDLDFDCKNLSPEDFLEMSDAVLRFLNKSGIRVEARDKSNSKLLAYRRNLHFPELLFELGLSGHREERFLIKLETEDQLVAYTPVMFNIRGCGMYFPFSVPPDGVLCSMKISALLSRQKGRDFYDAMFLLSQTQPDYDFLSKHLGIRNKEELKAELLKVLGTVDLNQKSKDFDHLLFNRANAGRILLFDDFVREWGKK